MTYSFRVGQSVRVIAGPRAGEVARVTSQLRVFGGHPSARVLRPGDLVHDIDLRSEFDPGLGVCARPAWLEPYHEPGDYQTLDELLRGVVPAGVKEGVSS